MAATYHLLFPRSAPGLLSIVIPVYNEEDVLPLLIGRVRELLDKIACPVEVILVNDGSTDRTVVGLHALTKSDRRFRALNLARNFGHQIAATAGLDAARGDAIVLMDADLQDPPELILEMLQRYREGYDVVYAQRTAREGETPFKRFTAWAFYRMMRSWVHRDLPADTGDYRLVSRRCLDGLNQMREVHRFLRGMVTWAGYPQIAVQFSRPKRAAGETKYPLSKMLKFAWTAAVSFSPLPLRLSMAAGATAFAIGSAYALYALARLALGLYVVPGWASVLVSTCLQSGVILMSIGILGEYVARIFEEVKGRPLYLISERFNCDVAPVAAKAQEVKVAEPGTASIAELAARLDAHAVVRTGPKAEAKPQA
jgi:polyisoprenyl-phosphate glycosyltransferase